MTANKDPNLGQKRNFNRTKRWSAGKIQPT